MLTQRELQVLNLIAEELTTEQIADRLCISTYTVSNHRRSLIRKADRRSPIGLIMWAFRQGFIK